MGRQKYALEAVDCGKGFGTVVTRNDELCAYLISEHCKGTRTTANGVPFRVDLDKRSSLIATFRM